MNKPKIYMGYLKSDAKKIFSVNENLPEIVNCGSFLMSKMKCNATNKTF